MDKCVAVLDRPALFRRHCREMRLAVILPFISDDPIIALIAVMDFCLQPLKLACHLPTDAYLNVAISITFA